MTTRREFLAGLTGTIGAVSAGRLAANPAPSGTRPFYLGFTPFSPTNTDGGYDVSFSHISRNADLVGITLQEGVPWVEALASSNYRNFNPGFLGFLDMLKRKYSTYTPRHKKYLSVTPANLQFTGLMPYWGAQPNLPLPSPWNTYDFNHPSVKTAFLNYCVALIQYFKPDYLGIGIESNIVLAHCFDNKWITYQELHRYVYTELKRLYPNLPVFFTIQYEHMLGLHDASRTLRDRLASTYPDVLTVEMLKLLNYSDLISLSTYPYLSYGNTLTPGYYNPVLDISRTTGKRICVDQCGALSQDVDISGVILRGSDQEQRDFITAILELAAEQRFPFVVNFFTQDYGSNYGTGAVALAWAYCGLWRTDGSAKPAWNVWDAQRQLRYRSA